MGPRSVNAIELDGLTRDFDGFRAVDGLTLGVPQGEVYGFLGPNGAGKTTTLKMLAGLLSPTSGQAKVAGEVVGSGTSSLSLRRKVGFLAEEPSFYPWMTAEESLVFVGRLFGADTTEARRRADALLGTVDLAGRRKDRIRGFSRGMRQRLGIAQALMGKPEVLLLDEPASALDPIGRKEILDLIASLRGEATIIMSSHVLDDVQRVSTWVGILREGRLVAEAPLDELLLRYARPVFHLEVAGLAERERVAGRLRKEPWLRQIVGEGGGLRILVADPEAAQLRIPGLVAETEAHLVEFATVTPTLEDVFIHLMRGEAPPTGADRLDQADGNHAQPATGDNARPAGPREGTR
jgi:ABC-2 type transport system ATP-binding protein